RGAGRFRAGRRGTLFQFRPGDRTGGVVRPQGAHREMRAGRGRLHRAAIRAFFPAAAFSDAGGEAVVRGMIPQEKGGGGMTCLPASTEKKLGLVIDLDICVGCQACVTSCKEWNSGGLMAPLTDIDPYGG